MYKFSTMDLTDVRANAFFGDEVFYDLAERNYIVLSQEEAVPAAEGGIA